MPRLFEIDSGRTRVVIIVPMFRVVIKIARIKLFAFLRFFWHTITNPKARHLLVDREYWQPDAPLTFGWELFGGFYANHLERRLWRTTHHNLLQPTIFSCGFFSIQRLGKICSSKTWDPIWDCAYDIGGQDVYKDCHAFKPRNFCYSAEGIRIVDYGTRSMCAFVLRHGHAYKKALDKAIT